MSGWLKNKFSTAAAIATGVGYQPVLFDYEKGQFVVKIQVAGAKNFEARGNDATSLKESYVAQYGKTATSMAGFAGKAVASSGAAASRYGKSVARGLAGQAGGRSRKNRGRKANRKNRTRRA
jgi:hypothetical protein